jgi:ferric-dicitrate binding protein FerR (iron transport regulator)
VRATRARADALWCAFQGVSANDQSHGRALKAAALLREVSAAEQATEEAMFAVCDDIRRVQRALERQRWMAHSLLLLLLADAAWLCWRFVWT